MTQVRAPLVGIWKDGRLEALQGQDSDEDAIGILTRDSDPKAYPGVVFSDPAARVVGDYQLVGAGANIAMDTVVRVHDEQTLRVTTTVGTEVNVNPLHATPVVLDQNGRVGLWVYVPDYTKLTALTIKTSLGDASFTNGKFQTYSFADADKQFNGLHFVAFGLSEMAGSWGAPDPATQALNTVRLGVTGVAGQTGVIYLGKWVAGWRSLARVVFVNDDGYASWFAHGIPVLDAYGVKSAAAIIGGLIGSNATWATEKQLADAYAAGHDLWVHGANALSTLADNNARSLDIKANKEFLRVREYTRGLDTYVWPNGVYQLSAGDQTLINLLKLHGFKQARGTPSPRYFKHAAGDIDQRWNVPIVGADASVTATTLKARIDAAVTQGDTAVIMLHNIALSGAAGIDYNQNALADVVRYASELRAQGKLVISTRLVA